MTFIASTKQFIHDMAPWLFALFAAWIMGLFIVYAKTGKLW